MCILMLTDTIMLIAEKSLDSLYLKLLKFKKCVYSLTNNEATQKPLYWLLVLICVEHFHYVSLYLIYLWPSINSWSYSSKVKKNHSCHSICVNKTIFSAAIYYF